MRMSLINKYFPVLAFTFLLVGCTNTQTGSSLEDFSTSVTTKESRLNETANTDTAFGTCGTIEWSLSKHGVLTISGTGEIDGDELSYQIKETSDYEEHDVKELIILDGICSLNSSCFSGYNRLQKVEMADSV